MNDRPYKVYRIEDGIVIDHIPNKRSLDVLKVMGLDQEHDSLITMGINLTSSKHGLKDVIKIENISLSEMDLNRIALIAPDATINIIKDGRLTDKHRAELPDIIRGIIRCPNPNCVTRVQPVPSVFRKSDSGEKVMCHYCERNFELKYISLV
ncbi:MAG: aspartate carbamoyltransferase regulatory subunit [Candidatus Muiribacteriaceae bacterium]